MEKGKTCPNCKMPMFAIKEVNEPKGKWVYYKCTNGNCNMEEKVFESK